MNAIRKAAVAGRFYPGGKSELQATVKACMARARPSEGPAPKAIIAPHAGYVYSGDVAASAYARVAPAAETIERVVLLGPGHRVPVRGLAASGARASNALGLAIIDAQARAKALTLPGFGFRRRPRARTQPGGSPALSTGSSKGRLRPASPGGRRRGTRRRGCGPGQALGRTKTLIVVSSDLAITEPRRRRQIDGKTAAIEALDGDAIGRDGAWAKPARGLLTLARKRGLAVQTVDIRNSGDTPAPMTGSWPGPGLYRERRQSKEMEAPSALVATGDFRADTRALLKKHGDLIVKRRRRPSLVAWRPENRPLSTWTARPRN